MSRVDPESTGVHPAWRKALSHVFIVEGWKEGDPASVIQAAKARLRANVDKLAALGSATYLNEVGFFFSPFCLASRDDRLRFMRGISRRRSLALIMTGSRRLRTSMIRRVCLWSLAVWVLMTGMGA